jgi:hypothetical protein
LPGIRFEREHRGGEQEHELRNDRKTEPSHTNSMRNHFSCERTIIPHSPACAPPTTLPRTMWYWYRL